jgi:hypothetical protein
MLSSGSLYFMVKSIAVLNFVLGLVLLLGNLMLLFLLISYPLHEFNVIQVTILKEDPSHNVFHLANLSKKQIVWLLTMTLLYFVMELMAAKVLYFGVQKRSRSKCLMWVEVHRFVWIVFVFSLVYNMFDLDDGTAAILTYVLWPTAIFLAVAIYLVSAFIREIGNNQDFCYVTFHAEKI